MGNSRVLSALDEIKEQLKAEEQGYLTSALTDLSQIRSEMAELGQIPALEDRVERTTVRSPVDGVINRLNYVTNDAFINSGDVLLEIVPTGSELIVETQVGKRYWGK